MLDVNIALRQVFLPMDGVWNPECTRDIGIPFFTSLHSILNNENNNHLKALCFNYRTETVELVVLVQQRTDEDQLNCSTHFHCILKLRNRPHLRLGLGLGYLIRALRVTFYYFDRSSIITFFLRFTVLRYLILLGLYHSSFNVLIMTKYNHKCITENQKSEKIILPDKT